MQPLHPINLPTLEQVVEPSPLTVTPETLVIDVITLMNQVRGSGAQLSTGEETHLSKAEFSSAFSLATQHSSCCALVVEQTHLLGIFTERDVVRLTASGMDLSRVKISQVMVQPVISLTLAGEQNAITALSVMRRHRIRHLPVVDEQGQVLGLITQDKIRQIIEPAHLLKLRCVGEVMSTPVIYALPTTSVLNLAQLMAENRVSCVVIVAESRGLHNQGMKYEPQRRKGHKVASRIGAQNPKGGVDRENQIIPQICNGERSQGEAGKMYPLQPVGIVTERDIIKLHSQGLEIAQTPAQAVMSSPVLRVSFTESLWSAHLLMQQRGVRRLVVIGEQGELQGLVTQTNVLEVFDPLQITGVIQVLQKEVQEQTAQLREVNQQLEQEVRQRQQVEAELERRVEERTAELVEANLQLQREIEEHKRTEMALQQRQNQWYALFNNALDAIAITDDEGRYVDGNSAACALFGVSRAEFLRSRLADFAAPEVDIAQIWQQFIQQGEMLGELRLHRPDGSVREAEFAAVANFIPHHHLSILRDISERQSALRECKQAEANLREHEQRLQGILDHSPAVIYVIDSQNKYLLVNHSYAEILATNVDNILGKSIYDFWPTEIADAFAANNRQVLEENQLLEVEEVAPHQDGIHTYISLKFPLYDGEGLPYAVCGISTDITERKRTEEALRESEAKATSLTNDVIDKSGVGIFILDADFRVVWVNQALEKFFGLKREDIIGKDKRQLICDRISQIFEDRESFTTKVLATYDNNTYIEKFACHILPDGNRQDRWLEHLSEPISSGLYAGGRIEYYTDITERKLAEQKIVEQAALIDIATDAIFVRDLNNRILFWNQGAERLYGWQAPESLGKLAHKLFYKESVSQLEDGLNATIEKGFWQGELEQITKTGKKITVASRWTLVRDVDNQPKSILVVNSDITEKKQLEKQFYRAQRLESLGTLASGIAHDLNNVFAPVLMIAQLLPLKLPNIDHRTQELLNTLENSAKRGADLVKQILTFARGTEGKRILLQVGHLLKEVGKIAQQTFPKSIEIYTNVLTQNLWMVSADPTQLHQVFMNLVVNARDAMPNGGTLNISAENRYIDQTYARMHLDARVGNYIVVTISDTGVGIYPEIIERVFDPFFTTKEIGKGTGLGLSTVLGIVKNHGGFVQVMSQVGKGTQFQVYLPAVVNNITEEATETQFPGGNGELILLVDDEAVVQQSTKASLEQHNYQVLQASDGIEAIALYAQHYHKISVVLMDLMMPNMDGLTAIRTLKAMNTQVKIIATSGLATKGKQVLAAGAKTFLLKPYTMEDLLYTLSAQIATDNG
ncbi:MAG: PAS domain S-box protein [Calothrix sp. MO_167.B12]|nr:PAS domain S-box protein [Calothrix sp. MO_167.B12]